MLLRRSTILLGFPPQKLRGAATHPTIHKLLILEPPSVAQPYRIYSPSDLLCLTSILFVLLYLNPSTWATLEMALVHHHIDPLTIRSLFYLHSGW